MSKANAPSCPKCSKVMRLKKGPYSTFWGCSGFPHCRGTRPYKVAVERKQIVGSPEQVRIWDFIVNSKSHLVVKALAGTGKSTLCREAMFKVNPKLKVLYLAFNKPIVEEFKIGAPGNCVVSTLNAIGNKAVQAYHRCELDNSKIDGIIADLWEARTKEELEQAGQIKVAVKHLVNLCQAHLLDGLDSEKLGELSYRYEIDIPSDFSELVYSLVPKVLVVDQQQLGTISYSDQCWLPVVLNLTCQKYDLIFVDEAQDLNKNQHALVLRLLSVGGRVIVVGDENQAIYGFRGSDTDSINNFTKMLSGNVETLPLTVNRRCAKSIIREAQIEVPEIQAHEDAIEGIVEYTDLKSVEEMYTPGDMLLCRMNAPLTGIAYGLIKRGVKAVIRGRDIGAGLISVIKYLKADTVGELLKKLEKWQGKEVAKLSGLKSEESRVASVCDKADCIIALSENCETVDDVIARIESVFKNFEDDGTPKDAVILSSIHKSKGLESRRVFWIMPEIVIKTTQPEQAVQEKNLRYVAKTRAKEELYYCHQPRQLHAA